MSVKKGIAPDNHFTQIPNELIRDRRVSDGAFRLICWITSHSDGFDISFAGIQSALGYGRDGLRSIVRNAEENDYLVRVQGRDSAGHFEWDYHVFSSRQDAIAFRESIGQPTVDGATIGGSPTPGETTVGSITGGYNYPHKEYKDQEKQKEEKKEREAANGDVGSWGAAPPTAQRGEIAVEGLSTDPMAESSARKEGVSLARDNKTKKPKRTPEGDKYFGQERQESYQRSLAAKLQRSFIPIEEMEPWQNAETFKAFEAYLLEAAKKRKDSSEAASIVGWKLQQIASGKAPRTEFDEWKAHQQAKQPAAPQQQIAPPLAAEQEAWIAIAHQIEMASDAAYARVANQGSIWVVTSNIRDMSGLLSDVMGRIPLAALPAKFRIWYPECYRLAKRKFPHLNFPAPLAEQKRAS